MQTLFVTGSGGAGRSTVAAATALAAAGSGRRVLLLSTDRAATADAILGMPLSDAPGKAASGLWAARIDAAASFRADAADLQGSLGSLLDLLGAGPLDPEELTELPGAEELALLRALLDAAAEPWELVVVDLPPTRHALAALALPEQLRRYLGRLVPTERQAARALRPMLAQLAGVPMPAEWAYDAAARADRQLAAVQAVIEASGTSVRLVVEPGRPTAEPLRTGLALFGHRLESVVANRLLPEDSADPWLADAAGHQLKALAELRAGLGDVPLHAVPHLGRAPLGTGDLGRLAVPAPRDAPRTPVPWTVEDLLATEGHLLWRLPLPGATRETLDLVRRGGELVVDTEGFRRILPLDSALHRCAVSGAALRDGALQVRFTPDPDLWPRGEDG